MIPTCLDLFKACFLGRVVINALMPIAVRVGDFTLSDFWGLGKDARMELGKGVSAVFINTEKARVLFEVMKEEVAYEPREVQEAIVGNGQLQRPSSRHPQYDCSVDYILDMV